MFNLSVRVLRFQLLLPSLAMLHQLLGLVAVQLLLDGVRNNEGRLDRQVQVDVGRVLRRIGRAKAAAAAAHDQG